MASRDIQLAGAGAGTRPGALRPRPPARPPVRRPGRAARVLDRPATVLEDIAGMIILFGKAMVACVTPPFSWRDEFIQEAWLIVKRCTFPALVSATFFGLGAPGLQGGNLVNIFGSVDRLGAFFVMASVREFAPWINGMVVAGVGGTAICADLGARKVREELDALATLGLDPVREVVAPRFLALGIVTPLMNLMATVAGLFGGVLATWVFQGTLGGYLETFSSNFNLVDLFASVIKTSLFGFIIAVCACYKGMNVKGGPEGVGRAVNVSVVMAFAAIWVFNYMFTTTELAAFPDAINLH